ncbi:SGNH/GDSL hydrolase family protein [Flavobacterium marginilacus]|uniref:SGNH/GDSL hydrolase family protein n=1 Tax=Flavobacterium marginilacus TaxID=3003256 RepID=UPI00248F43C3|nr:SGNH/GDSL hydrolase family protein [Flavobacterium marginilacus]
MLIRKITFAAVLLLSLNGFSQLQIKPSDKSITYMGRVKLAQDSACFYWPGTSAAINFKGSRISASLKSRNEVGYFYAIIDNDAEHAFKFKSDTMKTTVSLASGLSSGNHTLQLYKLSNNTSENIFYGFQIDGKSKINTPNKPLKRKIEFYGNSITAGHGVDVEKGGQDSGKPETFNNYYTYAALTARHYNAQYSCIARSGIGIMVSWFPEIMPEIYDRLNPMDPNSKWDFTQYTPDVVVVNLFQNDSWIVNMPKNEQFISRFGTSKPTDEFTILAYQNFISSIRIKYPNAHIICALGNMDATKAGSKWPNYIKQAVERINDSKIYSLIFPYKNTGAHPNKQEQQMMADDLIGFIDKNIKW